MKRALMVGALGIATLTSAAPAEASLIGMTLTGQLTVLPLGGTVGTQFTPATVVIAPGVDFSDVIHQYIWAGRIMTPL
ncbi:MAG TPA: hypothetical protein VFN77_10650 [Acetobacteraceae bacterium]|nr:hypothetical protein [Acetobacteraceae bacterium]